MVIPAAGQGIRAKSGLPKTLTPLASGERVIERQLRLLKKAYPQAEFVVVVGHRGWEVKKYLPPWVRTIHNPDYDQSNVAYSVLLGLEECRRGGVLVVYGDLVFNNEALPTLNPRSASSVVITPADGYRKDEVGVVVVDGEVRHLDYGLPEKWGQITYLKGADRQWFCELASDPQCWKHLSFEILNMMIDEGARLVVAATQGAIIREIDRPGDIPHCNNFVLTSAGC